jgi:hypothetical protein
MSKERVHSAGIGLLWEFLHFFCEVLLKNKYKDEHNNQGKIGYR